MNPRRPTPSGPKPDLGASAPQPRGPPNHSQSLGVLKQRLGIALSQRLLGEFLEWCRARSSGETCQQYLRKIQEIDTGERPIDASRWHVTAYKRLARWLCEEKGLAKACEEFKRVKSKRSSADLYIPSDSEVRQALGAPGSLGYFYLILVQSGLRAVEAAKLLGEPRECVDLGGYYRCPILWTRGSKRALWAYLLEPPNPMPVDLEELQEARAALRLTPFKYIRKWVTTKMLLAGVSEIAVDFIQGRVPSSVLRKHYADRLVVADKEYGKYAAWLRGWLG